MKIVSWLHNGWGRKIFTLLLVTVTFLGIPVGFNQSSAQAQTLIAEVQPDPVDSSTINRIQQKAEDFGGEKIGDTGLKNIKSIPENVPETGELIMRQRFGDENGDMPDPKAALDRTVDKASRAVERR